jgi:hypothetical protein
MKYTSFSVGGIGMTLDVDKKNMTILGVKFDNRKEFRVVWYAISSNMIEGWQPNEKDVLRLKNEVVSMRGVKSRD